MGATAASPTPVTVSLPEVEREFLRRLHLHAEQGAPTLVRACMSNLVIFCNNRQQEARAAAEIPGIVALHPARVLLLVADPNANGAELTASVCIRPRPIHGGRQIFSEEVVLHAPTRATDRLTSAMRGLLIGDLPTNLWWVAPEPPALYGPLVDELIEPAQQVIYDSVGWREPARGIAATTSWLARVIPPPESGHWRVVSDVNWRRLKAWRRLIAQALDPGTAPGALDSITEVLVEHGPHAVIRAWELVSWMAARLGWRVQAAAVQPGIEFTWQAQAQHGMIRVRIRRLSDGPADLRHLRIVCLLDGKPGALNFTADGDRRLAVQPEGGPGLPRTLTVPPQPLAELIARQLSDREPDPLFIESMRVAQIFTKGVLG